MRALRLTYSGREGTCNCPQPAHELGGAPPAGLVLEPAQMRINGVRAQPVFARVSRRRHAALQGLGKVCFRRGEAE